jgi:hypothetical protein
MKIMFPKKSAGDGAAAGISRGTAEARVRQGTAEASRAGLVSGGAVGGTR